MVLWLQLGAAGVLQGTQPCLAGAQPPPAALQAAGGQPDSVHLACLCAWLLWMSLFVECR